MHFDWDRHKASRNERKHGVSFDEAKTVFTDALAVTYDDPDHSTREDRYLTIGMSVRGRLIIVSHTDDGDIIRIISARKLTNRERVLYEETGE